MSSSSTTTTTIRKAPVSPTKRDQINHDDDNFNLKEWGLKSRLVSRDNTGSRRFSASYIRTIREVDAARSFRSNLTVSSTTASSPAYNYLTEEIDPSTYSFTTALRALQARSSNCWELQSPESGLTLNSKWNEAEKYICNPFSGEVPMECLSAKTLGNASFRHLRGRITMSAPLVYSKQAYYQNNNIDKTKDHELLFPVQEKITEADPKDVGTQCAESHLISYSSSNCSPVPANSTPSIKDRPVKLQVEEESPVSSITRSMSEEKLEVKETREDNNEETKRSRENDEKEKKQKGDEKKKKVGKQVGECFSFRGCSLWTMITRHQQQHHHTGERERDPRKNNASVHPPYS
ncbi:uncharacterized protein LOC124924007 [Impatiens glandulifera]|uniref:uncharacterized protein LOC124924007 n=1 Tax=Impatiens glandulifera TaxID=253017 RepID=UPI001FB05B4D|nr:uncharacterized protein LOC124924007 [Impatiens glandulifera]